MTHLRAALVASLSAFSLVIGGAAAASAHPAHPILQFSSMTPVTGAAVGTLNDRGIVGGGKAWRISSGSGEVDSDGSFNVTVQGLVLVLTGANPVGAFGVTVSCVTPHGAIVNLRTGTAPATPAGDATIAGTLNAPLPHPCLHPILFVTSPGGAWFAMSNREDD